MESKGPVFSWLMSCCVMNWPLVRWSQRSALKNTPPLWNDTGLSKSDFWLRLIPLDLGVGLCCNTNSHLLQSLTLCKRLEGRSGAPGDLSGTSFEALMLLSRARGPRGESALWKAQIGGVWLWDHHPPFFLNKSRIRGIGEIIGICHCWIEWKRSVIS